MLSSPMEAAMADHFDFQIPGLTEREESVVDAFMQRMHEIAEEEGAKLSLLADGVPVLFRFIHEMLPDYTHEQRVKFSMHVIDTISGAMELNKKATEGNA